MKILCVIPARYASSRFPGKPLAKIVDHPMILWVYHRACAVADFTDVVVATDDERIMDYVVGAGGKAVMTPGDLASGTDRVAYVAKDSDADIIVNLQGDEPLISPKMLSDVCQPFSDQSVQMTTAIKKANNVKELKNPSAAWVVIDNNMDALYFSRAVLPNNYKMKDYKEWIVHNPYYEHIGIYAYRRKFLSKIKNLSRGNLEKIEDLEQLRVLENGYKIRCVQTTYNSICVDTPQDLQIVENLIRTKKIKMERFNEKM